MLYSLVEVAATWMMASQRAFEAERHLHQPFGGLFIVFFLSSQLLYLAALISGYRPGERL